MAKSLLYYTCPNEKCGKSDRIELDNGDKVVSHATLHNANAAMRQAALKLDTDVVCYWCKTRVEFELAEITVLKAVKYDPIDKLNDTTRHFVTECDLAGGGDHIKIIAEQPDCVQILDRELGRLDSTHLSRDWKLRIAGRWLRSFIQTWAKGSKNGSPSHAELDAEYTLLMNSLLGNK